MMSKTPYTDIYFTKAVEVLKHAGRDPFVTMQFFAKKEGVLCGVRDALEWLPKDVDVRAQEEGSEVRPIFPVMYVSGPYSSIAEYETPVLGILARRTLVATNTRRVVEVARGKPVIFMGARHDDPQVQRGDGWAAYVGGATASTTECQCRHFDKGKPIEGPAGTMPHALIAAFGGNTVEAALAYKRWLISIGSKENVIVLVDYHNDCLKTSIDVCQAFLKEFGELPWGVRLDTSERLVDEGARRMFGNEARSGVSPELVRFVRAGLDTFGGSTVKIVVSGGFTPRKIVEFESLRIPVDAYGVGSSILGHVNTTEGLLNSFDFTADIVAVNGNAEAKAGRRFVDNPIVTTVRTRKTKIA